MFHPMICLLWTIPKSSPEWLLLPSSGFDPVTKKLGHNHIGNSFWWQENELARQISNPKSKCQWVERQSFKNFNFSINLSSPLFCSVGWCVPGTNFILLAGILMNRELFGSSVLAICKDFRLSVCSVNNTFYQWTLWIKLSSGKHRTAKRLVGIRCSSKGFS